MGNVLGGERPLNDDLWGGANKNDKDVSMEVVQHLLTWSAHQYQMELRNMPVNVPVQGKSASTGERNMCAKSSRTALQLWFVPEVASYSNEAYAGSGSALEYRSNISSTLPTSAMAANETIQICF